MNRTGRESVRLRYVPTITNHGANPKTYQLLDILIQEHPGFGLGGNRLASNYKTA